MKDILEILFQDIILIMMKNYSFIDIQYKLCIEGAKLLVQSIDLLSKNNNLSKSTEEVNLISVM